jgi:ubiquinone/menaquinone biosynthesis C-methylase UbiE
LHPLEYVKADISTNYSDAVEIDATEIPYEKDVFDLIICNHVLEHIPNYLKAISEIYRVLKPNGVAILQTPYSKLLSKNFEEKNINTDDLRYFFFGEKDHYRIFSEQHFFKDLTNIGFVLKLVKHTEFFDQETANYYGVNYDEDLIQVIKKI